MPDRIPDAISVIEWPAGWVDSPLVVKPEIMTLRLDSGATATLITTCTERGTTLIALDAPGAQRLGRMEVVATPFGPKGGPIEVVEIGRRFIVAADRPLADAWDAVVQSMTESRAEVEAGWEANHG